MPADPYAALPDTTQADPYAKLPDTSKKQSSSGAPAPPWLQRQFEAITQPRSAQDFLHDPDAKTWGVGPKTAQVLSTVNNVEGRAARGVVSAVAHPFKIAKGIVNSADEVYNLNDPNYKGPKPLADRIAEFKQEYAKNPRTALENAAGDVLAMFATGKLVEGSEDTADRVLPPVLRRGIEILTKTGPHETAKFVVKTAEDNAAETARVAERNAAENARVKEANERALTEHANKTQSVEAENAAKRAEYEAAKSRSEEIEKAARDTGTRRGQLARQLKQQGARMVERIRNVKVATKARIDGDYAQIREKTAGATVPRESLASAVNQAEEMLKGSSENIKIFRDILSKAPEEDPDELPFTTSSGGITKVPKGHPIYDVLKEAGAQGEAGAAPADFSQLQGYYSELGDKLSGGDLPNDVYLAMKSLHGNIGEMMQKLATERGVGSQLRQAQTLYRDYMQTFRESAGPNHSGSPLAQVLDAKDPSYAIKPLESEETAARVRSMLSRFDPAQNGAGGAGQLYDNFRESLREFDGLGKTVKIPEAPKPPKLEAAPEPPTPVQPKLEKPNIKVVRPSDVHQLKAENQLARSEAVRNASGHIATILVALDAVRRAVRGDIGGIGEDVGARFLYAVGKNVYAKLLENPKLVNAMSNLTKADLDQIMRLPPEQRAGFENLVKQAQEKGVRVSPSLSTLVGVGSQLPPNHPLMKSMPTTQ